MPSSAYDCGWYLFKLLIASLAVNATVLASLGL
jgi:hypothetical protein